MAGPVPYRTSEHKYTPSFPPVVYYRDTFGLDGIGERRNTDSSANESDNDSIVTRSTVRTTMNIHPMNNMYESTGSKRTNMTQSYQVEQLTTTRILSTNPESLLRLSLVAFGSAIQLLIFSVISLFYDGCPYYIAIIISLLLIFNTIIVFTFTKCRPTRNWLISGCIAATLSFIESVGLFFWTTLLFSREDTYLEKLGARDNRIVHSTRIAMYTLEMLFATTHAVVTAISVYLLFEQLRNNGSEQVKRGYFLTKPAMGHQNILVPIELRQVRAVSEDEPDNVSIGVQTSGSRPQHV